jgi:hypothetical protein
MLIHYLDSHTAVLRQWQISPVLCCSCIYDNSGLSITNIYFRVSKSGDYQIVINISFLLNISKAVLTCKYRAFTIREVKLHTTPNT